MANSGSVRLFTTIALVLFLPLLSLLSSLYNNMQLLLILFLLLAMTVFVVSFTESGRLGGNKDSLLMPLIFSISLTLLLSQSLASTGILGWDVHGELNVFSQVSKQHAWLPNILIPYNSVLSVSILPVILSIESGLDGISIFKILFPLLYSISPVLLFKLYRKILSSEGSFLAVFFFVAYRTFYFELIALAREEVAEVLLLLALLLLFSNKNGHERSTLSVVLLLTFGVITAHYAVAYILLFVLACSFVLSNVFRNRILPLASSSMLAVALIMVGIWYAFLTNGFDLAVLAKFLSSIALEDLFNLQSRPAIITGALGVGVYPGLLHGLNRIIYYLVNGTLVLGFFAILYKRQKNGSERKMIPVMMSGLMLIGGAVVIPNFAVGLNITRLYHISLLLAAPCFVYGIDLFANMASRLILIFRPGFTRVQSIVVSKRFLAAAILFMFLLFDSGWVWAASMDRPTSFLLDRDRMLTYPDSSLRDVYYVYYTSPQDSAAAVWLKPQLANARALCADSVSLTQVLISYGNIREYSGSVATYNLLYECEFNRGYVYLSLLNNVYGIGDSYSVIIWPISDITPKLVPQNLVYSNGGAVIYAYPE